jgi:hypothetical protein
MKKISYLILTLLITLLITPIVFAKENVEIKSIDLEFKSTNVGENSKPTFKGLEMNFDLSFKKQGDYAKYEVVVKNNTNTDFQISEDTSFNGSKYITYKYKVDKILKAKGETTVHVTITYENPVDDKLLTEGKYSEKNSAVVQLQNEDGEAVNPNTYQGISIVVIILFVASIAVAIALNKQDFAKYGLFILIGLCLIPLLASAIETLKLTINVDVEIKKVYEVNYSFDALIKETEKSQYNMKHAYCRTIIYVGEVKEENKYQYCENVIRKDEKVYGAGETVEVMSFAYKDFIDVLNACERTDDDAWVCTVDEYSSVADRKVDEWDYGMSPSGFDEFIVKDNDVATMNFTGDNNSIDPEHNWAMVKTPTTFTMPDHDVLFYQPRFE